MDQTTQKIARTIWVGGGLFIVILATSFTLSRLEGKRPSARPLPVIGQIADFTLTNQVGQRVTLADLHGHPWVADVIFTRCGGPCPRMTRQMESLQTALRSDSQARLVTLTTDPEFDTPAVLNQYAARFNANAERWHFLTGAKTEIAALGRDSLKLTAIAKPPEERADAKDLFIHSTIFVVVDKQGRLRGAFETGGDNVEWTNVQPAILAAVRQLERER